MTRASVPSASAPSPDLASPGSLLGIGIMLQFLGGVVMGATWGTEGTGLGGLVVGGLIAWAGWLALLVGIIAFGVKIGIESARR